MQKNIINNGYNLGQALLKKTLLLYPNINEFLLHTRVLKVGKQYNNYIVNVFVL